MYLLGFDILETLLILKVFEYILNKYRMQVFMSLVCVLGWDGEGIRIIFSIDVIIFSEADTCLYSFALKLDVLVVIYHV